MYVSLRFHQESPWKNDFVPARRAELLAAGRGNTRQRMNRRTFLIQSAGLLFGGLLTTQFPAAAEMFMPPETADPRIALIIDDIGFNLRRAEQFLTAGIPITFSILPRLCCSESSAQALHEGGHELMLHQPMEPFNPKLDPGPGALYVGDKLQKIDRIMEENIAEVPYAIGINNHMGSRFTSCQKEMKEALKVVKANGLFFVDSLTTNRSMGYKTAIRLNMAAARRNIFLDYSPEEPSILLQINRLKRHAIKYGHAIGIGHPFMETARAIDSFKGMIRKSGISMVQVSRLVSLSH